MFDSYCLTGFCSADSDEPRERAFNPFRTAGSLEARELVSTAVKSVESFEVSNCLRKRKRKPEDQKRLHAATQAVVCDLIVNSLSETGAGIHLTRSNRCLGQRTRYDHPANTRQLKVITDAISSAPCSWTSMQLGGESREGFRMQTVIQPTARFNKLVGQLGIVRTDILMTPWREPLVLKHRKDNQWEASRYVEYDETQETLCLRAGVDRINDWLRSAELSLEMQNDRQSVDLSDRCLRRIFTCNSFCSGGRLFGGFWQPMKKSDRFSSIKINGESIAEVDFGQIMPRLVYSIRGISPKMPDLYSIPGFENYRPGIKKFMSSMLFTEAPIRRMPRGLRELFPPSVSAAEVTKAIQSAHPDIGHMFGTGIGHRCQYLESEILVSVLNRLMMLGLTALPIHDAVLVPSSKASITKQVMLDVFREKTGFDGTVEVVER